MWYVQDGSFQGERAGVPSPRPSPSHLFHISVPWVEGAPHFLHYLWGSGGREKEGQRLERKGKEKGARVGEGGAVWPDLPAPRPSSSHDGSPTSAGPGPLLCPEAGRPAELLGLLSPAVRGQQPCPAWPSDPGRRLQSSSRGQTLCWAPGQRPPRPGPCPWHAPCLAQESAGKGAGPGRDSAGTDGSVAGRSGLDPTWRVDRITAQRAERVGHVPLSAGGDPEGGSGQPRRHSCSCLG